MAPAQEGLFQLPDGFRRPRAQVIILTGPSGSGKTSLASRVGLPSLSLDDFYRGDDEEGMPMLSENVVDWDDPASWDGDAAFLAVAGRGRHGRLQKRKREGAFKRPLLDIRVLRLSQHIKPLCFCPF